MNAMDSVASYIDTEIKGSQESVNAVADSMEKLAAAIYAGYDWDDYAYQASHSAWEGETGKAYDEWATCFNSVAFDLQRFSRKASEGVRAFADELRWQQDKMASLRRSATDAGLIVVDWYILHPDYVIVQPGLPPVLALKTCAADDGNGNGDLKVRKRLVDKFEELNGDAENARSALSDSVRMYLTPWYQEAQEYGYLDRFFRISIKSLRVWLKTLFQILLGGVLLYSDNGRLKKKLVLLKLWQSGFVRGRVILPFGRVLLM